MKTKMLAIIALLIFGSFLACAAQKRSVGGFVSCEVSIFYPDGAPASCALVRFASSAAAADITYQVGSTGKAVVSGLRPNCEYLVSVSSFAAAAVPAQHISIPSGTVGVLHFQVGFPGAAALSSAANDPLHGAIIGVVRTKDCEPISGITVALSGSALHTGQTAVSDGSGIVAFVGLAPGQYYELYAMAAAGETEYLPMRRKGISVQATRPRVVPLVLSKERE
jgi:hypothetical protein